MNQIKMIDKQFIDSAKYIRSEFLLLDKELSKHQNDLKKLSDFLFTKIGDLKDYRDNVVSKIKSKEDLNQITNHLLKEISSIEEEERKINSKVDKLNIKLDKLKESEKNLYSSLIDKYPSLTKEEIKNEIFKHLNK